MWDDQKHHAGQAAATRQPAVSRTEQGARTARGRRWAGSAGAFGLSLIAAAIALESGAAEPARPAAERGAIQEVIVSARRDAESQQDVPVAVSAFAAEDIERIAPRTLRDIDGLMPNVFIGMNTAGPGAGAIFNRGIG
jgi:iron complex outermembrane receptor protein